MYVPADPLQNFILGLLFLILGTSAVHANPSPECTLQAWVRAPDLAPGTLLQGDARLKLTAGCTPVESASLGLRLKERSVVKTSRSIEATKRPPKQNTVFDPFDPERLSPLSPWALPLHDTVNCSADMAFEKIFKDKNLWSVREEERIVFESTQAIDVGEPKHGSVQDVVQEFAILVPLTNFPPVPDYPHSYPVSRNGEFVNVETIYEYFVQVAFKNGTTGEIPAGFTAFQPLYDPPPSKHLLEFRTVKLQTTESVDGSLVESDPIANYSVDIFSTQDAFAFAQESYDQFIKVMITRSGRARTFVEPLSLHLCIDSIISPKWAFEYTSDPTLQPLHKPNQILRATFADFKIPTSQTSRCSPLLQGASRPSAIIMPNATSAQIAAGEIVATVSNTIQLPIHPDPRQSTDFETYYHTLSSALLLSLNVPRTHDETPTQADIVELRASRKKEPEVAPDEEAWVPWQSVPEVTRWHGTRTYTGNASVFMYPAPEAQLPRHCVRGDLEAEALARLPENVQVVMSYMASLESAHDDDAHDDDDALACVLHSPVHYLAEDARAPTFVDASESSIQALLAKTAAERDVLAPSLEPVVSSPPEGEERVHRYYRVPEGERPLIYVGETWVKKVAHEEEYKDTVPRPDTMPVALAKLAEAMKHMFDEL